MALSEFGKIVERVQAERGMRDARLAEEAGISRQNLYRMKRSNRPNLATIHVLAKALNTDVSLFLECRE